MSHFDIGVIDSIVEFPRGSRKAPKLLIVTEQGKFLLKRRARGKDDPYKVAFCHAMQLYLAAKQFPLPHLIGTQQGQQLDAPVARQRLRAVRVHPRPGVPADAGSDVRQRARAGAVPQAAGGLQNRVAAAHAAAITWPRRSSTGLRPIPPVLAKAGTLDGDIQAMLEFLLDSYRHAAETVDGLGIEGWPKQIVHADWHPGNMLFRDNHVVAVIDYDSARQLPRDHRHRQRGACSSRSSAATRTSRKWPEYLDESRFKRFLRGL